MAVQTWALHGIGCGRLEQKARAVGRPKEGDALTNAIEENDVEVAAKIRRRGQLGELAPQVRIVDGYYDLDTGKVEWTAK